MHHLHGALTADQRSALIGPFRDTHLTIGFLKPLLLRRVLNLDLAGVQLAGVQLVGVQLAGMQLAGVRTGTK
jgi:hypothetical protein